MNHISHELNIHIPCANRKNLHKCVNLFDYIDNYDDDNNNDNNVIGS